MYSFTFLPLLPLNQILPLQTLVCDWDSLSADIQYKNLLLHEFPYKKQTTLSLISDISIRVKFSRAALHLQESHHDQQRGEETVRVEV